MSINIGYNHEETIQKLERLNQLETVTAEQRIRIEKYRTMYETLKADHEQVEDDKEKHMHETQDIREDMKSLQTQCQSLVTQARSERDQKFAECEELKLKIVTPEKMEVIKIKLQEDVELAYKRNLEAKEIELDRYRNEFNRLRYDYTFLKSEYEQKETVLKEMSNKFGLEKEALQKQINSLNEEINTKGPGDTHKLRLLQKENTQLNLTVKSLRNDIEELMSKNEYSNVQTDQTSRLQARQVSELSIQCKALEGEKEAAKVQKERVQKELENSIREQDRVTTDLHKMERENLQLKSHIEELTHSHKMDLSNVKVELTKDRCELEQEKAHFQTEMNLYKNKVTVQDANILELKKNLELKEHEVVKKVQSIREEEWNKINKLESDKVQVESQLSLSEQQRLDMQNTYKSLQDQIHEGDKLKAEDKEKHDREINGLRSKIIEEKQRCDNLDTKIEKLSDIKIKFQKLTRTHEATMASQSELKSDLDKSLQTVELLRNELELSQTNLLTQREFHQKKILEIKRLSKDSKNKLALRLNNVEKEHKVLKGRYDKVRHNAKKKNKKLKSDLECSLLEIEELKIKEGHYQSEKQTLMTNMSMEQERMKKKFDKFRHRQQQLSHVLNTSNFNAVDNFNAMDNFNVVDNFNAFDNFILEGT